MNRDEVFLHHVLDEIIFLENQTQSLKFEDLLSDPVLQRAVLRSLEIIGKPLIQLIDISTPRPS